MQDGSIRSLGKTNINVDKVLRDDIRQLAQKNNMTIVDYLRLKVEEDKQADPQAVMLSNSSPVDKKISRIESAILTVSDKLENLVKIMAELEPEEIAFFKILAYGQEREDYTPEMLKADISRMAEKVKSKLDSIDTGEKQTELSI